LAVCVQEDLTHSTYFVVNELHLLNRLLRTFDFQEKLWKKMHVVCEGPGILNAFTELRSKLLAFPTKKQALIL